jgi:hypothetical protein
MLLTFFPIILCWKLIHIDKITAKTTIRLWHELHISMSLTHDFSEMLSPDGSACYFAAIRHDDIRAIAKCRRHKLHSINIECIANAPQQLDASIELLKMMNKLDAISDFDKICSQPRWYFEELYNRL